MRYHKYNRGAMQRKLMQNWTKSRKKTWLLLWRYVSMTTADLNTDWSNDKALKCSQNMAKKWQLNEVSWEFHPLLLASTVLASNFSPLLFIEFILSWKQTKRFLWEYPSFFCSLCPLLTTVPNFFWGVCCNAPSQPASCPVKFQQATLLEK